MLGFEPWFFERVAAEVGCPATLPADTNIQKLPAGHPAVRIVQHLARELEPAAGGRLLADGLARAAAVHLLRQFALVPHVRAPHAAPPSAVLRAVDLMRRRLAEPLTIDELAAAILRRDGGARRRAFAQREAAQAAHAVQLERVALVEGDREHVQQRLAERRVSRGPAKGRGRAESGGSGHDCSKARLALGALDRGGGGDACKLTQGLARRVFCSSLPPRWKRDEDEQRDERA
jgi:hypothetical protein